jgi:signal peptidase
VRGGLPSVALRLSVRAACVVVGSVITSALLAITLPSFLGYHNLTVTGGSMGKALPTGSVAVTRTIDFRNVQVGDIIAFQRPGAGVPVVHRVVDIREVDGVRAAVTKGDANAQQDPETLTLEGRGDRVVYHVPWAGYALVFVRTPGGIVALTLLAVATWLVRDRKHSRRPATQATSGVAGIAVHRPAADAPVLHGVLGVRTSNGERGAVTLGAADAHAGAETVAFEGVRAHGVAEPPWVDHALVFMRSPGGIVALTLLAAATWLVRDQTRSRRTEAHATPSMVS